jgi:hypothetical protein
MIAAVKRGNKYQFADLTAGMYEFGMLPLSEQGNLAVLVKENDAEQIILPEEQGSQMVSKTVITGKVGEDGMFSGYYDEEMKGSIAPLMRSMFQQSLDSTRKEFLGRSVASRYFERPETDSLMTFDGKDLSVQPKISMKITRAKVLTTAGDVRLLSNPLRPFSNYLSVADRIEKETARKLPYDMSKLMPSSVARTEVTMKLPAGWKAALPESVKIDGPLAHYEMTYAQVGDELRMTRIISGTRSVVPASQRMDIVKLLRQIGSDNARVIVVKGEPHSVAMRGSE